MWTFVFFFACENGKTVTVRNSDPEAVITSHAANAEVYELTEETFQGSVSDLNDNATELRTSWFIDERPLCIDVAPTVDGLTICPS
ncbi:MAG: hypothetical protein VX278_03190, partial [Myxococcota bacterium]|nr:hypothetical protein [Myxococcota bacterium]